MDLGVLDTHRCRHAVAPAVGSLQGRSAWPAARATRPHTAGGTQHGVETGSNLAGVQFAGLVRVPGGKPLLPEG